MVRRVNTNALISLGNFAVADFGAVELSVMPGSTRAGRLSASLGARPVTKTPDRVCCIRAARRNQAPSTALFTAQDLPVSLRSRWVSCGDWRAVAGQAGLTRLRRFSGWPARMRPRAIASMIVSAMLMRSCIFASLRMPGRSNPKPPAKRLLTPLHRAALVVEVLPPVAGPRHRREHAPILAQRDAHRVAHRAPFLALAGDPRVARRTAILERLAILLEAAVGHAVRLTGLGAKSGAKEPLLRFEEASRP